MRWKAEMVRNHETEFKYLLNKKSFHNLLEQLAVDEILNQKNYYFDGECQELSSHQWALRLRQSSGLNLLTLKGPSKLTQGVASRVEIESEIDEERASKLLAGCGVQEILTEDMKREIPEVAAFRLGLICSFSTRRHVIPWRGHAIELDEVMCDGEKLYELELECLPAKVEELRTELEKLIENSGETPRPSNQNKLEWALKIKGL